MYSVVREVGAGWRAAGNHPRLCILVFADLSLCNHFHYIICVTYQEGSPV